VAAAEVLDEGVSDHRPRPTHVAEALLGDTGEDQLLDRRDVARESGQDVPSSFRSKKLDDCRCMWPNSLLRRFRTNR
jgi:hypothetical protein